MTVFVVVRDQMTWLVPLCEFLAKSEGVSRVILVDNDSTYPPLVEWLKSCPYEVSRGPNTGHWSPWHRHLISNVTDSFYAVTDPDLELVTMPPDWVARFTDLLGRYPDVKKVGPALRVDDLPCGTAWAKRTQVGWWRVEVEPDVWQAAIDTTLFVARRKDWTTCYKPALRVAGDYAVRHFPWYLAPDTCPPDVRYYLEKADLWSSGRKWLRKAVA